MKFLRFLIEVYRDRVYTVGDLILACTLIILNAIYAVTNEYESSKILSIIFGVVWVVIAGLIVWRLSVQATPEKTVINITIKDWSDEEVEKAVTIINQVKGVEVDRLNRPLNKEDPDARTQESHDG